MSRLDKLSTFYQHLFDASDESYQHFVYTPPVADGSERMVRVHAAIVEGQVIAPALVFVRQKMVCAIKPYEGETFATVPFNGLLVMADTDSTEALDKLGKPSLDTIRTFIEKFLPLTLEAENPEGKWIEFS